MSLRPTLSIFVILLTLATATFAGENIRLQVINGRDWLISPEGKPFFAHGVTHVEKHGVGTGAKAVSEVCKSLGFNAYGYGCPPDLDDDMPYLKGLNDLVPISIYRNAATFHFLDIFDPVVQQEIVGEIAEACAENRDKHNLIGYLWTDLAAWPLQNSKKANWVDFIRSLPADAPGQQAYRVFLAGGGKDDKEFLRLIARQYFKVLGEATRKNDPGHLVFGDRFTFATIVPEVIEEMLPYVDAIAIQPNYGAGFPRAQFDRIHAMTKKPIVICDFAVRFKDGDKDIGGGRLVADEKAAGEAYTAYIRDAVATKYIIGAFWCNLLDSGYGNGKPGIKQGLFRDGLAPRPALHEQIRKLNKEIAGGAK